MKRDVCGNHECLPSHGWTCRFTHLFNDDGQDLIEYALLAAVISVGFVATIQAVAGGVLPLFDGVIATYRAL